jgi:hypothetical protein
MEIIMTQPISCSCIICKKLTSNLGIAAHHKLNHVSIEEIELQKKRFTEAGNKARKGIKSWNSGLVGDIRYRCSDETKKKLKALPNSGRGKTEEGEILRIKRIKGKAQKNNGGYREGSSRGKKGWYKGYYCDSSWELAFLIYHLENNIDIQRYSGYREYEFNGKLKKYFPDFIVNN